jgi:phosphohistidine swiveling domain-containing protein
VSVIVFGGVHGVPPRPDAVGGKASALARAGRAGLPVPDWFALSVDAFTASLGPAGRKAIELGGDEAAVRIVEDVRLSPQAQRELSEALAVLCPRGELVAVRSSGIEEDGVQRSFAGQFDSYLSVSPGDVDDRVRAVWRSGFGARASTYRALRGLARFLQAPAVIVQRMVDARAAGVAFSADPVSGRRGIAVVSGLPGLGSALVSGEAQADTWLVDRRGHIVERRIVPKGRIHRADGTDREGVRRVNVEGDRAAAPALSDNDVLAVAALAREAAHLFGRPQDIEWAFEGDRLWLLQARPVTSLTGLSDPDAVLTIWDNSNIVESYSGVTTPLTFSFVSDVYEHVYRQFCRMVRVPARVIAAQDDTFRNMVGLIHGRLYYNLLNWYRVLALLPGSRTNRRFMEQMMGVREPLPEGAAERSSRQSMAARLSDAAHLAWTMAALAAHHFTLNRRVRAFYCRLDEALAPPDPPLADQRPDELVAHYRGLRRRLLVQWDAPILNDFFAMLFYGALRTLTRAWCGDLEGTLQNDLVGGTGGMVSAEPAVRVQRLARLCVGRPELVEPLAAGTLDEILTAVEHASEFRREYDAYLEKFGERSVNELKLESATLHDDPLPLLRAVGHLARQYGSWSGAAPGPGVIGVIGARGARGARGAKAARAVTAGETFRTQAHERVRAALGSRPLRRLIFGWVLRHAQMRVRDRENLRLERTRLFGRVRRIFIELGRRFQALDVLSDPRDIFYLEVDEVLAFVDGRSTSTNLRALAAIRKEEFQAYAEAPPPDDRFETRGLVYRGHSFCEAPHETGGAGDELRGLGCCPGIVRGPVRVVRDPRFVNLDRRTILVAEHTDPGWIMIFPSALGVLVERGSLLSHAAIVARELGIPAIVSLPGVTRWLEDGDWVELNGSTGVVRRIVGEEHARQANAK